MGKVLRVLVFIVLALGIAALVLAGINYTKREVLIGRTHALEESVVKIAQTLEAEDPPEVPRPSYPQRDVSPVTSQERPNPDLSAFWESYNHLYEPPAQPIPTLNYGTQEKRLQLRAYYRIDPATGKKAINSLTGKPDTTGEGTMAELLDQAFERAKAQNALLHKTRAELPKLRDELIQTIEELNNLKQTARADKRTIEERTAEIARLEGEKRDLENRIALLEDEKRELNALRLEAQNEVEKLKEEMIALEDTIQSLEQQLEKAKGRGPIVPQVGDIPTDNLEGLLTPGDKGKIVSFSEQWKFVVIEFSDEFMDEMLGPDRSRAMPPIEVMVRRPGMEGPAGDFVTRLRLRQVIREQNLVIADILMEWQQVPMELGDVVYF